MCFLCGVHYDGHALPMHTPGAGLAAHHVVADVELPVRSAVKSSELDHFLRVVLLEVVKVSADNRRPTIAWAL